VTPEDLPPRLRLAARVPRPSWQGASSYREARFQFEREFFAEMLRRGRGNVSLAAALAGIHRATLHQKMKELRLTVPGAVDSEAGGEA
jgi:DNA-binding NtrC family response regulator